MKGEYNKQQRLSSIPPFLLRTKLTLLCPFFYFITEADAFFF